jgi:hypothetical protein
VKKHIRAAKPVRAPHVKSAGAAQPFSPFVHRPEYDVYVNGEYAGSDPDPLVRLTIKREWLCSTMSSNC